MIVNDTKSYVFQEFNVSVSFYNLNNNKQRHRLLGYKLISLLNWTRLHHCGIIFTRGDTSIVLTSDKKRKARFVDTEGLHKHHFAPCVVINLGVAKVSINQITDYIKVPYIGNLRSILLWYYFTHGVLRLNTLQPKTCTLLVSNILRLCGYGVTDCITPKELHKELQKICN